MTLPQKQPPEVVNLINLVNTYLQWENKNGPPRNYRVYHPSAFGDCLRKMQYQRYAEDGLVTPEEDNPKPNMIRIWETGHKIQERWEDYFTKMNVLRGYWRCQNPFCSMYNDDGSLNETISNDWTNQASDNPPRLHGTDSDIGIFKPEKCCCGSMSFSYEEIKVSDPSLNFHGHADLILDFSRFDISMFEKGNSVTPLFRHDELPQNPIVVDMKTSNSYGFKNLGTLPSFRYRVQLTIYMHVLDLSYGVLIYENKDNSDTKIYKVDRDEDLWEKIQEQAYVMNSMVEEKKLPPPRPVTKDSTQCKYCEFRSICHSSAIWDDPDLAHKRQKFYGNFE